MQATFNLLEIMIPEDEHLDDKVEGVVPKCNIFMSKEFYKPNPKQNMGKRALVLI